MPGELSPMGFDLGSVPPILSQSGKQFMQGTGIPGIAPNCFRPILGPKDLKDNVSRGNPFNKKIAVSETHNEILSGTAKAGICSEVQADWIGVLERLRKTDQGLRFVLCLGWAEEGCRNPALRASCLFSGNLGIPDMFRYPSILPCPKGISQELFEIKPLHPLVHIGAKPLQFFFNKEAGEERARGGHGRILCSPTF